MSNIDLYRFKEADVLEITQDAHDEFERTRAHRAELVFRDEGGEYWTVEAASNVWYRHRQGRWRSSDPPNGILEGPFSLVAKPIPKLPESEELEPIKNPVELLETIVGRAREGYEQGLITSSVAEVLVKGVVAIDSEREVCTVGVRSGDWYSFKRSTWKKISRPDSAALLNYDESHSSVLKKFLSKEAGLPERVTDPWDPPSGIPTRIICSQCNANLSSDSLFCAECGAPAKLPPTKGAEPALTTAKRSRFTWIKQLPAARTLLGILITVGVSAVIPYVCYKALNIALNPTMSIVAIFTCSLLISFGFFTYSLRARRPSTAPRDVQPVAPVIVNPPPTPTQDISTRQPVRRGSSSKSSAIPGEFGFCGNCGSRIVAEGNFCEECGAPVRTAAAPEL